MRTLYFEINGQTLRKIDNFSGIIKGSKQYLKCHFTVKILNGLVLEWWLYLRMVMVHML